MSGLTIAPRRCGGLLITVFEGSRYIEQRFNDLEISDVHPLVWTELVDIRLDENGFTMLDVEQKRTVEAGFRTRQQVLDAARSRDGGESDG